MRRPRLVYLTTHPVTAALFLRGQLTFMRESGFDVTVIASPGPDLEVVREREGVDVVAVPMERANHARKDVVSLARLTGVLRTLAPDIVNTGTTKAGLLGSIAARVVGTPIRIYLLRGLRLETATGAMRAILGTTERVASACATEVACVSPSLMERAVAGGYVPRAKARVVGYGSSNGVDTERFRRTPELRALGAARFAALGVEEAAPLVAFVGRLVSDKGIAELLDAFEIVKQKIPGARLALLGGDLGDEPTERQLADRVRRTAGVISTPRIDDLAPYYARIDVLAFPSHREGFPNVVMEAASSEVPVVATRATGVVDAIVDGETGMLAEIGDSRAIALALLAYLENPELARAHGRAARERVVARFDRRIVWQAWLDAYRERLASSSLPPPRV